MFLTGGIKMERKFITVYAGSSQPYGYLALDNYLIYRSQKELQLAYTGPGVKNITVKSLKRLWSFEMDITPTIKNDILHSYKKLIWMEN